MNEQPAYADSVNSIAPKPQEPDEAMHQRFEAEEREYRAVVVEHINQRDFHQREVERFERMADAVATARAQLEATHPSNQPARQPAFAPDSQPLAVR